MLLGAAGDEYEETVGPTKDVIWQCSGLTLRGQFCSGGRLQRRSSYKGAHQVACPRRGVASHDTDKSVMGPGDC